MKSVGKKYVPNLRQLYVVKITPLTAKEKATSPQISVFFQNTQLWQAQSCKERFFSEIAHGKAKKIKNPLVSSCACTLFYSHDKPTSGSCLEKKDPLRTLLRKTGHKSGLRKVWFS
jgi:hypothetical protein